MEERKMPNGFAMRKTTLEKALSLKSGVEVTGWRMGHPYMDDYKGEANQIKGGTVIVENPLFHPSQHRDHETMKLIVQLSNGGEVPVMVKKFRNDEEPQDRIKFVDTHIKKFRAAGVTPMEHMAGDNNLLVHKYAQGRKLEPDEVLAVWLKLEDQGIDTSHKTIQQGHWRMTERGVVFIPA